MKKIAIPTQDGKVDSHFGHCKYYTVYTVGEDNNILTTEKIDSPQGCGCKSDIAAILKAQGIDYMLAGNMGKGALNKLSQAGLSVTRGCDGLVEDVINDYLAGKISDSGELCDHNHDHGAGFSVANEDHVCGNH